MRIIDYIRKNWVIIVFLAVLAGFFFVGTASYNYFKQADNFIKWGSPDETANYLFTKVYAESGELKIFERYNLLASDLIHPRSFRSDVGFLKPVSFLGIILIFGQLAGFFGLNFLPYLTPLLAALGLIFFYLLIKAIFSKRIALISVALAAIFPVYTYYSARSFFHNVLFLDLLIIGLYFVVLLIKSPYKSLDAPRAEFLRSVAKNSGLALLAGVFIGLTIITRASELLWLAPLLLIVWLANFKKIGGFKLIIFLAGIWLALLPMFYYNQVLYNSPFNGGYSEMNRSLQTLLTVNQTSSNLEEAFTKVWDTVFYFGFQPEQSLKMFYRYVIEMFPLFFWPAMAGGLWWLITWRQIPKKQWLYLAVLVVMALILIFYYGSWKFTDNPDPKRFTIGNSYTRYWLPIYFGILPFMALFLSRLSSWCLRSYKWLQVIYVSALVFSLGLWSVSFVVFGSEEGLYYAYQNSQVDRQLYNQVLTATETNSVIITQYHDKLLFPERKVVVGLLSDDNMNYYYAQLAEWLPVYYFNFKFPDKDFNYLNSKKLLSVGLQIKLVEQMNKDFALYKLEKVR